MSKKTILVSCLSLIFVILVAVVIYTNINKESDFGEVKEVSSIALSSDGEALELEKKDKTTKDGKHKIFNDFYGSYQFEYPSDYDRETEAANHIHLSKKNSFIQIDHMLILEDEEGLDRIEGKRLVELFESKLAYEKFEIDSKKYRRDSYQNPVSDLGNGVKEKYENEFILGQDFVPMKVRNESNDIESNVVSERRYYLYNGKCATSISLVCLAKDFEKESKALDEMLNSRKPITETYKEVYEVKTDNITLNVPKFYSHQQKLFSLGNGLGYICKADSSSAFAGSFIGIFENKKDFLVQNIASLSALDILFDVYDTSSGVLSGSNESEFQRINKDIYNPFAFLKDKGYEVNTYISSITLLPSSEPESRILDMGSIINVYAVSLVKDGKETDLILTTPMERTNELLPIIKNIAE